MTVLVLAEKIDATVDRVMLELARRSVAVLRCDTSDFPTRASVHGRLHEGRWEGWLSSGIRRLPCADIWSVWCRAPLGSVGRPACPSRSVGMPRTRPVSA